MVTQWSPQEEVNVRKNQNRPHSFPHSFEIVETRKELHGWYPGRRECTAERMLINPYNGCSVGCFYCYSRALPGYFETFHKKGTIFISKDFDKTIAKQIDSVNIASCGYLSPVTDPFQEVNKIYRLSEKIIKVFIENNIPIEFITKCEVPDEVIDLIKEHKHCFGQVSILTTDEKLRKILAPGGAVTDVLFNNIRRMSENNVFAVCRIDPIFPYITDIKEHLTQIVERAVDSGARHIVASIVDLPVRISDWILDNIKKYFGAGIYYDYKRLYTEKIGYINAKVDYRKGIFDFLRNLCDRKNITFALCMEYEIIGGNPTGLNRTFMSSTNCEGMDIPVYIRKGEKFYPSVDCYGNCLDCREARCGVKDLAMGKKPDSKKDFKLKDYKKWSQQFNQ